MKLLKIWYQPEADVEFSWVDVESMILFSERHYDYKCRELSKEGGVLIGMRNMFRFPINRQPTSLYTRRNATITFRLDASTADLLAKCVEQDLLLLPKLMSVVKALNNMYYKMNKENRKA